MAKDDYNVLVFTILTYLYGCLKRKFNFDEDHLYAITKRAKDDEYIIDVLRFMQGDGYICGLSFTKPWGNNYILINDLSNMEITSKGIEYLTENSTMSKVKNFLLETGSRLVVDLIKIVFMI